MSFCSCKRAHRLLCGCFKHSSVVAKTHTGGCIYKKSVHRIVLPVNFIVIGAARRREIYLLTYLRFTLLLVCLAGRIPFFRYRARRHIFGDTISSFEQTMAVLTMSVSSPAELTIISDKTDLSMAQNYRRTSRLRCTRKFILFEGWW